MKYESPTPVKYQLTQPIESAPVSGKEIMKYVSPTQSIVSEESRRCLSRAITFYKRTRKANFPALQVAPTALVSKNDEQGRASNLLKFIFSSIRRFYKNNFAPSSNEEHPCSSKKMNQENQPSESNNDQPTIYRIPAETMEHVKLTEFYS